MPTVRFAWCPSLVEVRRETCPRAKWNGANKSWTMSHAEAEAFVQAAHRRLDYAGDNSVVTVDQIQWRVGFVQGAPCAINKAA